MKRHCWIVPVIALSLTWIESAGAANITYSVNDSVGIGSVTGFIETDGGLGTLSGSNFLDWSLILNDGNGTATLLGPLSGANSSLYISGTNVSATPTTLVYNFNGDGGFMNFFGSACSPPEWSFETIGSGSSCNGTIGNEMGIAAVDPAETGTYSLESGLVVFAATSSAVPEPSYSGLVLITLLVFGFIRAIEKLRQ